MLAFGHPLENSIRTRFFDIFKNLLEKAIRAEYDEEVKVNGKYVNPGNACSQKYYKTMLDYLYS